MRSRAIAYGLGAAALFGASVPALKLATSHIGPLALAGLLYLGAGLALTAFRAVRGSGGDAPLGRRDAPALVGIVVAGAVVGPVLLVLGLSRLPGSAGALLLNLEAPFTAVVAVLFFGEHLGSRGVAALASVAAGACALAFAPGGLHIDPSGAVLVALACAAWALDTNLTQRLSLREPVALVGFKGLCGGVCTLGLAAMWRETIPGPAQIGAALLIGALGYAPSVVFHVRALRELGAARQSAIFATAPFVGAVLAWPVLGEAPGLRELVAAILMAAGVALLASEKHAHLHAHEALEHEHLHVHDEHHQHRHDAPVTEPHSHLHRHEALVHEHPHEPDVHHRHPHGR